MRALRFATVMSTRLLMNGVLVASVVLVAFSLGKARIRIAGQVNVRSTINVRTDNECD